MLFHLKRFETLTGVILMCVILGAGLFVPATNAITLELKLTVSKSGTVGDFDLRASFPTTIDFAVNDSASGSTFFWQFGDGTNSSSPAPTHTYNSPCVYDVQVEEKLINGSIDSGEVVFGAFRTGTPGGATLAVCPAQGTEGFIPVELAGGFFPANQEVNVAVNGANIKTATADRGGIWTLDVSSFLTPEPNGTQFTFTTSPSSVAGVFTTLEGIRATPTSGGPGTSVQVEGRSYPSHSSVPVYLGSASLGTAVTDENGSFLSTFGIPFVPPLTQAGTFPYTTFPPILGSQASFASAGVTMTITQSTTVTRSTTQTETTTQSTTTTVTTTTTSVSTTTASTYAYVALGATTIVILAVAALAAWVLRGRRP